MAIRTRTYLKSRFETEDVPTQQDYADWLDSFQHLTEDPGNPNSAVWGQITGTLSDQTDLQTALDGKLARVEDDAAPKLGGRLDCSAFGLGGATQTVLQLVESGAQLNSAVLTGGDAGNPVRLQAVGEADAKLQLNFDGAAGQAIYFNETSTGEVRLAITNTTFSTRTDIVPVLGTLPSIGIFDSTGGYFQNGCFYHWRGRRGSAPAALPIDTFAMWMDNGGDPDANNGDLMVASNRQFGGNWRRKLFDEADGALVADFGLFVEDTYIAVRDASNVTKGLVGLTAENEPFFAHTNDGTTFNPNDGAVVLGQGKTTAYGSQFQIPVFADPIGGLRDLHIDAQGNLVDGDLPTPAWSETDFSATPDVDLGNGSGVGTWTSLNCVITIPQTVNAGDRLDIYMSAQVANKTSNQSGSIEFGLGIDAGSPTGVRDSALIPEGFQGQVGSTVQWTTHGGLAAAQTLTLYARINNGSAGSFGLDVLATVQATVLTVSRPATAAALARVESISNFLDNLVTYGSVTFADNAVATVVSGSSDDWSNAVILDRFDTNGHAQNAISDEANNRMECDKNGRYELKFVGTFQNGNNDTIEASFFVNGNRVGVPQANTCDSANREELMVVHVPTIDLVDGDLVDVRFQNHDSSTNVTWDHGVASMRMVDVP